MPKPAFVVPKAMRSRLFAEWLVLFVLAAALAGWASTTRLTERIDLQLQDFAVSLASGPVNPDITIVAIDDQSLAEAGAWPWPRERHARLVDELAGARSVMFDVLFLDPTDAGNDEQLASAIRRSGNVTLPHSFVPAIDSANAVVPTLPIPVLADAAAGMGHVAADFDNDGSIRRLELMRHEGGQDFPHLAVSAFRQAFGSDPAVLAQILPDASADGNGGKGGAVWPIIPLHSVGAYPTIPASALLSGSVPPEMTDGRLVLVGATAQGLGDSYPVPASAGGAMPGVEIQANLLDALIADRFVNPLSPLANALVSVLALCALFAAFWAVRPRFSLFFALALAVLVIGASLMLPMVAGYWFAPGAALLALVISYPLWGWRRLVSVTEFLRREAGALGPFTGATGAASGAKISTRRGTGGFDVVARQMNQFSGLVATIRERYGFVQTVIQGAPDAILVLDENGRVVMSNERATALFGSAATNEAGALTLAQTIDLIGAKLDAETQEMILRNSAIFTISRAPLADSVGEALGEFVQFHDVTTVRNAAREKREMLEFLSHDMRSPQVSIIALTDGEIVVQNGDSVKEADYREKLQSIRLQARRTLKLADDFVNLARLSQSVFTPVESDLAAIVHEAADRAQIEAGLRGITVNRKITEDAAFISGDPSMLARALDNLLGNAIKYSPKGSRIDVVLAIAAGRADQKGRKVAQLVIGDQGPGLPQDRIDRPFTRFETNLEGERRTLADSSLGLGLAFVGETVARHGAHVEIESKAERGTRFTLEFALV